MRRSVGLSAPAGHTLPAIGQRSLGSTALILLAVTQALHAQTPTAAGGNEGLAEVIVTATKQAAIDINKVPVSISAYSEQEMDTRGIRTIGDLASITPGLVFSQQNNFGTPQTNIEIRGIQSRTSAPTTGIYLDDTPMIGRANNVNTGQDGGYPQVFDLERVEVLRGPQGTLFGASSEGGAVRFISKQPSLTDSSVYGRASAGATRYGDANYEVGIAGGMPVVQDKVGFRASFWYQKEGGWIDRSRKVHAVDLGEEGGASGLRVECHVWRQIRSMLSF